MKGKLNYFSKGELFLWGGSVVIVILSFFLFDRGNYSTLAASLIGVTSLIFCAKGNLVGPLLMVVFSVLYGAISYTFAYYGEMITYLGMTLPMEIITLISWIKNPYEEKKAEVRVNRIGTGEMVFLWVLTAVVTLIFYFILSAFHTANIIPSTISVATSFFAVYLTFRRSASYAVGYAANDIVLVILWALASAENRSYFSVMICFVIFFVNDLYGYVNWKRMERRQTEDTLEKQFEPNIKKFEK
ncbi:MAG: nicotinamide mononucleotide transporter [Eubacterium sp.]|nr:nicotinamide mononucleotide transporter [Eubacterium sp.]